MIAIKNKANLTKLIRFRLTGEARKAIYGQVFATIEQLKDFVKSIYAPAKTVQPRSCIGFFGNRSGGPRTGHRARPQVADRGALYLGLLLNTDTKLNKQSRTMFQGWSRRNNPQAKVLTTVPRAACHQVVVSRKSGHLLEY